MKKVNFRSVIWMALAACSLSAYVYLNSTTINTTTDNLAMEQGIEGQGVDETKTLLPDVALIKKIIGIAKVAFHINS
ncbi:MAG TPA: hypothetical protein ENJ95_21335 [Bacteroidetes bacterium]|nr:hypothetical protein [Bacteroidota bacterium]